MTWCTMRPHSETFTIIFIIDKNKTKLHCLPGKKCSANVTAVLMGGALACIYCRGLSCENHILPFFFSIQLQEVTIVVMSYFSLENISWTKLIWICMCFVLWFHLMQCENHRTSYLAHMQTRLLKAHNVYIELTDP